MTKRKKHLKYRARHVDSFKEESKHVPKADVDQGVDPKERTTRSSVPLSTAHKRVSPAAEQLSALDQQSVRIVRSELIHLLAAASVIMIVYIGLWLMLARAGLESKLTSLIQL